MRTLILCFLVLAVTATLPAQARDVSATERAALSERVENFTAALKSLDVENIISVTPPKIWHHIAEKAAVDLVALRKNVIEQTANAMKEVRFEEASMDLERAEFKSTPDGEPYVLIPTTFIMSSEATGKIKSDSFTLALLDEGKWYLLSVSDTGQLAILRTVYPSFNNVELPKGTMKAIK